MSTLTRPPLLFLGPRVPSPQNTGAKIRTHALLRALQREFSVDYAGFLQPELPESEARAYLRDSQSVFLAPEPATGKFGKAWLGLRTLADARPATVAKYSAPLLAHHVREWLARHPAGIVHADHIHMAGYLELGRATVRAIDEHNVEAQIVERLAEQNDKPLVGSYLRMQARRMRAIESRLIRLADLTLAVSEGDAQQFSAMAPGARVEVIRNGVDLDFFQPPQAGRQPRPKRLILTGSMNWFPNEDAVIHFCREIMPLLPGNGWSFDIVGHAPPAAVRALASSQVRVTGTVDDVRPYVHEAQVFIVPLRVGGGSRLKILEAFAMGIPVVSTTVGCEGLNAVDGTHLLIADAPQDFAAAVQRVATDAQLARKLAQAAKAHVEEHFSWVAIGSRLVQLYRELLAQHAAG